MVHKRVRVGPRGGASPIKLCWVTPPPPPGVSTAYWWSSAWLLVKNSLEIMRNTARKIAFVKLLIRIKGKVKYGCMSLWIHLWRATKMKSKMTRLCINYISMFQTRVKLKVKTNVLRLCYPFDADQKRRQIYRLIWLHLLTRVEDAPLCLKFGCF